MKNLKYILDEKLKQYYNTDFIPKDPICIPHRFSKAQDIEIAGFLASTLAFGKRTIIINKATELLSLMQNSPHDFILNFTPKDLNPFYDFKHRTVNSIDILHILNFLQLHYRRHSSLENAFSMHLKPNDESIENALIGFRNYVFSLNNSPTRTSKHIPTPSNKSSCKRLNMFLRWMVRNDNVGVDFGLWKNIRPSQLVCPCDVHVINTSKKYNLITRPNVDWKAAIELTENLKKFCKEDPIKYDFALFGLGIDGE